MKKKILCCMLLFAGILLFGSSGAYSDQAMPVKNLRYPVLLTLDNGGTASGFYLNFEHRSLYFVTAKHVIFRETDNKLMPALKAKKALLMSYPVQIEKEDPLELEIDLERLSDEGLINFNPSKDVVIIRLTEEKTSQESGDLVEGVRKIGKFEGSILSATLEGIKKYDEILPSNEVFIFGYPTSLGLESHDQIDFEKPLLRKGVVAGKNDKKRTIILDCPVYYGNSGGPCVEVERVDPFGKKFSLIGVVSEFVPFTEKWINIRHGLVNSEFENSGYSIVEPIDTVIDLIDAMESR